MTPDQHITEFPRVELRITRWNGDDYVQTYPLTVEGEQDARLDRAMELGIYGAKEARIFRVTTNSETEVVITR